MNQKTRVFLLELPDETEPPVVSSSSGVCTPKQRCKDRDGEKSPSEPFPLYDNTEEETKRFPQLRLEVPSDVHGDCLSGCGLGVERIEEGSEGLFVEEHKNPLGSHKALKSVEFMGGFLPDDEESSSVQVSAETKQQQQQEQEQEQQQPEQADDDFICSPLNYNNILDIQKEERFLSNPSYDDITSCSSLLSGNLKQKTFAAAAAASWCSQQQAASLFCLKEQLLKEEAAAGRLQLRLHPNPHGKTYKPMRLYLLKEIQELAVKVWGSLDAAIAAKERRIEDRWERKKIKSSSSSGSSSSSSSSSTSSSKRKYPEKEEGEDTLEGLGKAVTELHAIRSKEDEWEEI